MRKRVRTTAQRRARAARRVGARRPAGPAREERRAEQRLALVLHGMSDGFVMLDRDWRFVHVNTAAARFFEKAPEDLLGRPIHEVLPGINDKPIFARIRRSMDERLALEFEERCEASGLWYELRCLPSGDSLIVFFREVTERKQLKEAHLEMLAKLRHSFYHESTAPLRAQAGFAELLLRSHGRDLAPEAREYAERIIQGAEQQAEIIQKQAALLEQILALDPQRRTTMSDRAAEGPRSLA